jgi:hypothetical protein
VCCSIKNLVAPSSNAREHFLSPPESRPAGYFFVAEAHCHRVKSAESHQDPQSYSDWRSCPTAEIDCHLGSGRTVEPINDRADRGCSRAEMKKSLDINED